MHRLKCFKDDGAVDAGYQHYQHWINGLCTPDEIALNMFVESPIPHPTAFMRTSTLHDLGGYLDSDWPEDYDLWCRALLAGYRFGKPETGTLLRWRDHAVRASRQDKRYAKQAFLRCKARYLSELLKSRQQSQISIWGTGPTGLKLHDYLESHGITVNRFIDINSKLAGSSETWQRHSINAQSQRFETPRLSVGCVCGGSQRARRARRNHSLFTICAI